MDRNADGSSCINPAFGANWHMSMLPSKADWLHHPAAHLTDAQRVTHNTALHACDTVKSSRRVFYPVRAVAHTVMQHMSSSICQASHVMQDMSSSTAWGCSWTSQYKATCLYPEVAVRVPGTTSPFPAITEGTFHAFWGPLSHGEFAIYCVKKKWEDWLGRFALVATLIT